MNKEDGKCVVLITDANFEPFKKGRIKLLMESALDRHIRRLLREYASRNALISESRGKRIIRMNEQGLRRMVNSIVQEFIIENLVKEHLEGYRATRPIPLRKDLDNNPTFSLSVRDMKESMEYVNKRLYEGLIAARYKVVDGPKSFQTTRGHKAHPMLTLSNGTNMIHIVRDDSHYIVYTETEDGKFDVAKWIHPDVINAIHKVIVSSQL